MESCSSESEELDLVDLCFRFFLERSFLLLSFSLFLPPLEEDLLHDVCVCVSVCVCLFKGKSV